MHFFGNMASSHRGYGFMAVDSQLPFLPPASRPTQGMFASAQGAMDTSTTTNVYSHVSDFRNAVSARAQPGRRHGSTEQSSGPRGRSRRRSRDRTASRTTGKARQMGPEETADWDELMNNVFSRMETIENNYRRNAQSTAQYQATMESLTA